jgi:hypothetical protein
MRAAWLALLALAACGLWPGPDPSPAGPASAGGPWQDLGAVQLCLGDQVLGPPAAPPGGLCVKTSAADAPCLTDAACGSREACVCGRCVVPYCTAASDCGPGSSCTFATHRCDTPCAESAQCGDVAECLGGVCRGRCARDADCQHGELCDGDHVCVVAACADGSTCQAGERCQLQRTPRQALEPAALREPSGAEPIVLYLDLAVPSLPDQRAIWRAVSSDGLHFRVDPSKAVVSDTPSARAASAVVDGGRVYLYYEVGDGGGIAVTSAADGVHFDPPRRLLDGSRAPHAPSAVHLADGTVALYYQTAAGLGLATGPRDGALADRGVVLTPADVEVGDGTPGTPFWTPVTRLWSPHARLGGPPGAPVIQLWFAAFGRESGPAQQFGSAMEIPANASIGFAAADPATPDRLAPWPYGPVFDRVVGFLEHRDELSPTAVDLGDGGQLLYYLDAAPAMGATGPDGPFVLGRIGVLGGGTRAR